MKEQLKLVLDLSTALLTRAKTPKKPNPPDDTEQIDTSSTKKPPGTTAGRLAKEETKSSGLVVALVDDGGKLEDLKVAVGDRVRDAIRKGLVQAMIPPADQDKAGRGEYVATKVALAIEEEVSAATKGDQRAYTDKIRSILANLKDPKNPELRKRLIDGLLTPR